MFDGLKTYLRSDHPDSAKMLTLYQSATGLLGVALLMGGACAVRILWKGDLGTGAVAGLAAVIVPLAGVAGWANAKPEAVIPSLSPEEPT